MKYIFRKSNRFDFYGDGFDSRHLLICYLHYSRPKGKSANLAILKNCMPKGIPIIVTQRIHPIIKFPIASSKPDTKNQIMFNRQDTAPPSSITSFPNGFSDNDDILKHCKLTGIPTIVIHQRIPASHHPIALNKPPHIIQIKFPIKFIF